MLVGILCSEAFDPLGNVETEQLQKLLGKKMTDCPIQGDFLYEKPS